MRGDMVKPDPLLPTLRKATLLPVYLDSEPKQSFHTQFAHLSRLLDGYVEWADPCHIDQPVDAWIDAVVVPDLNGLAYRMVESFSSLSRSRYS